MKKLLSALLVVAMLMSCTAALADDGAVAYDGSEVTITFTNTMGNTLTPVLDEYLAEFNKLYPNIHVEYTAGSSYDDVRDDISKKIFVGQQPNVAYCYPDHVALYNVAKAVMTLDEYIDSTAEITLGDGTTTIMGLTAEQKADYIEGYYNEGAQFGDGKMYTLPMSKSTEVLYYNKTFFDVNGLVPPTTWDEMEELCEKIQQIDPISIPLGYDSSANWFITMCEQMKTPYTSATGEHFVFDTEENRAFVKRFADWYNRALVITQELNNGYTSELFKSTDGLESYMSIGSSAGALHQRPNANADGSYPFEVGITTIPQADPANPKVISQGPSLCIFKKANPQEEAASWLLVKFLTTNVEFQAAFSIASGYVPVIKSVTENEVFAEHLASANGGDYIAALSAKVCMEQVDAYYTSPAFPGSSEAREQVGNLIDGCMADCLDKDFAGTEVDAIIADRFAEAVKVCQESIAGVQ